MLQRVFLSLAVLLGMTAAICSAATPPSLVGSWTISFYSDPAANFESTQCLSFKQNAQKDGELFGSWSSTTYPYSGSWAQKGAHIELAGTGFSDSKSYSYSGSLASNQNGFLDSGAVFGSNGVLRFDTGVMSRRSRC